MWDTTGPFSGPKDVVMEEKKSGFGPFKLLVLLATAAGAVMSLLRKKREAELDEALWEEPRAL